MIPDKSKSWFYSINESQVGPLTFEQLEEAANSGAFNRQTTRVWHEGLENWVLASSIEGLFLSPPPLSSPPLSPPPSMLLDESYAHKVERNVKFIQTELIFPLTVIPFMVLKIASIYRNTHINTIQSRTSYRTDTLLEGIFYFIAFTALCTFLMYFGEFVYRKWKFVEKYSNISAQKAVWFLFIPLYNFYWVFKIFAGYHKPFNRMVRQCKLDKSFELESSWGLLYALIFIPSFFSISVLASVMIYIPIPADSTWIMNLLDIVYISATGLYILTISRRVNLVYAQIRANRA